MACHTRAIASHTIIPIKKGSIVEQPLKRFEPEPVQKPLYDVVIIGAGFAGLCAAIKLREAGYRHLRILEKASSVGGTWYYNQYPGCACDIPSHLYSLSFAPNPHWTRPYPQQAEILAYLNQVVARYQLGQSIDYGVDVSRLTWLDEQRCWRLELGDGQAAIYARFVINATGPLSKPQIPNFPGLKSFTGTLFHSAQWNHAHDLAGKHVGVVGTGASAIQFVPEIVKKAARVTIFQRTPAWLVPRLDEPYSPRKRWAYQHIPGLQWANRARIYWRNELVALSFLGNPHAQRKARALCESHLKAQVADPLLRAKLTPDYQPGCKRVLLSNDWYPALQRPHVELLTQAVARITPNTVVGAAGAERRVDTLIMGTGFNVRDFIAPMRIYGRGAQELGRCWTEHAKTYFGITTAGFPNLFFLVGPSTGLGHNSIVFMIEAQVRYIVKALAFARRHGPQAVLEVAKPAQEAFYNEVQQRLAKTVWMSGCSSWYRSGDHVDTLWPGFTLEYWWRTRRFDYKSYSLY
jgi:cation diffusion facilitator CzcD-associated flavoprotein CzcO